MDALKRVAVVFTGGTISMRVDPLAGGAVPVLSGADILARTPGLDRIAEVVPIDRGLTPASHFTFESLLAMAGAIRQLVADPTIGGVVLVQGTDTIEETSLFLELVIDSPKPIVVTGAMRNAGAADADGPSNLQAAVRCAAARELGGAGVVVVLGGTIEPADDVTKTHSSALDAFRSLNLGRVGVVEGERIIIERVRGPRRGPLAVARIAEPIPIVTATVAMDAAVLDAVARLRPAGIVVAATGAGNTSAELLQAGRRAMGSGIPLVLATRCSAGEAAPSYAFPGGGATWVRAGAMLPGTLSPAKARIALSVALGAGLTSDALRAFIAGPEPGIQAIEQAS